MALVSQLKHSSQPLALCFNVSHSLRLVGHAPAPRCGRSSCHTSRKSRRSAIDYWPCSKRRRSDPFEGMRKQIHRKAADERQRPYPYLSIRRINLRVQIGAWRTTRVSRGGAHARYTWQGQNFSDQGRRSSSWVHALRCWPCSVRYILAISSGCNIPSSPKRASRPGMAALARSPSMTPSIIT
jgi:hypothetical protein